MDTFGDLFLGTFLTILVVVLLLVVSREVRKRLFPGKNEGERAGAMTELLLFQAKLEREASDVSRPEGDGPAAGAPPQGGASQDEPGSRP